MQEVDPIAQLEFRIGEVERQMSQMLQMVRVSKVYDSPPDLGFVDVLLTTDLELKRRPIMTQRQGEDTSFWLPSVNECGLLLSPSGDVGNSVYLHGIGFDGYPVQAPPGDPLKVHENKYRDSITETIDTEAHTYKIENPNANGEMLIEVKATGEIKLKVGATEFKITETEIEGKVGPTGTTKFKFNAVKADIRVGAMWMVLTAALANVNGATFVGGGTNIFNTAGICAYTSVPAGAF